eukprot:COSAG04_NODE_3103_length_3168_cov_23.165289_1_plen_639_part_10
MFGKKKDLVFNETAYLKGPPQKVLRAKADYKPSHAGTVAMDKGEIVSSLGLAPGSSGKDWTKVRLKSGVEGFVPTSFLAQSQGPPQLLNGKLQVSRTDLVFEGDTGGMAGLVIKAPMEGVLTVEVDRAAADIARGSGVLKTLKISYHEKGREKGEKRDIEILLPEEHAAKLERGMPELQKEALEQLPQGDWKERMAAKKEEMRSAALGLAINTAGAMMQAQDALEKNTAVRAIKNFGVADEYVEEAKRDFEAGERVESMGGDQGTVVEASYVEAREATMVKVKLDSGRVRTYFDSDIRRIAQAIFGPESVKIKSLSKSAATDDISLQLEEASVTIDAEVLKFKTTDGWTEATIFLRDITSAKLDSKATFEHTDPMLATKVTYTSLMFESKTANLQLLVTEDRGNAIIQAIDEARQAWLVANRERLQKRQQEQATSPADLSLAPAEGSSGAGGSAGGGAAGSDGGGGGWGADSTAVPAGWPPTAAEPEPAQEEDSPGAFGGGGGGGWGDAIASALGDAEPEPTPAIAAASGDADLLGMGAAATTTAGGATQGGWGADSRAIPAGWPPVAGGGDLLTAPAPQAAAGGLMGGQLDAGMFTVEDAAPEPAPAPEGGSSSGGGGDGWGDSSMAIPADWPPVAAD